jgi:hypothetical protein
MKTIKFLLCFFAAAALILACQKEVSHESGNTTESDGSLLGAGGACQTSTVGGVYQKDTALNSSNYVDVSVTVNSPGSYLIYSDTVNGMWFRSSGNFSAAGVQTVRLPGFGKPIAIGTNSFNVFYDSTQCTFSITTIAGVGAAAYSLSGSGSTCINASFQGTYTAGVATNASNTMTVEVNVTTVGTYSITSTAGGITFSKSGVFAATGIQTVVLTASGTPSAAGTVTFPVVAGSSTCSKDLTVNSGSSAGVYTLVGNGSACSGAFSVQGTYTQGTALTAANTVTVQVNVTTVGSYSLTTNTANGVSFSASGTFSVTGLQTVVMAGTGTPVASGSIAYTVTGASTTCTFNLTVVAAVVDYFPRITNDNWSYEIDDVATDSLLDWVIPQTISAGAGPSTFNDFLYQYTSVIDTLGYYRKAANDYYHWVNLADYLSFDADQWVEFIFLKDNQAANFSWTTTGYSGTIFSTPITVRIVFTIVAQNTTVSLTTSTGTASYPNTIEVREKYEYLVGSTWTDATSIFGYYEDYYSKNIGWIKEQSYDQSSAPYSQFELRRYQVY